ncbi:MAG TPA: WD40 repeat domain-containing protein [Ktedonobacterales bacterium]|jgi:WD40 repeat protein
MLHQPPCIDWAEKLTLRYEDLTPDDQVALDAHIKSCSVCQAAQADYHFLDARLRALPPPGIKPFPRLSFPASLKQEANEAGSRVLPARQSSSARQHALHTGPFIAFIKRAGTGALIASLVLTLLILFSGRGVFNPADAYPLGATLFSYQRHTFFVTAVAWSPDGRYLASGSWDHSVQVWNARTGALVFSYQQNDNVDALAWSPDSRYLASGSWDFSIEVWNIAEQRLTQVYQGHNGIVSALAWSPDGRYLASGSWDDTMQVWDARTGATLFTYQYNEIVDTVAWSPDGRYLAVGGRDDYVHILSAQRPWPQLYVYAGYPYQCAECVVNAVAWSPDSRYIASGDRAGIVQVWDTTTGRPVITYKGHTADVYALAWSPDGRYIASGSVDRTVQVWQAMTGLLLVTHTGHSQTVAAVAWSPDGRYIASGSWDNTVQVWQATYDG